MKMWQSLLPLVVCASYILVCVSARPQSDAATIACNDLTGYNCTLSKNCKIAKCKSEASGADDEIDIRQDDSECSGDEAKEQIKNLYASCLGVRSGIELPENVDVCCPTSQILEDVPFLNEPLICEDYQDQGYSCVEGNKCQISECSATMDQRSTDPDFLSKCQQQSVHVEHLKYECFGVRSGIPGEETVPVCCHSSLLVQDDVSNSLEKEPACEDFEGYKCVETSKCSLSKCLDQNSAVTNADLRGAIDDCALASDDVTKLNESCLGVRSSVEEFVCCNTTYILKGEKTTEDLRGVPDKTATDKLTDDIAASSPEKELFCQDFEGFECVETNNCSLSKCLDQNSAVSNADLRGAFDDCASATEDVGKLTTLSCLAIRNGLEGVVCCNKTYILKGEETTKDPRGVPEEIATNKPTQDVPSSKTCLDFERYKCVPQNTCQLSKCLNKGAELTSVDLRTGNPDDECDKSEHVSYLDFNCNTPRNSLIEEQLICCHDSFIQNATSSMTEDPRGQAVTPPFTPKCGRHNVGFDTRSSQDIKLSRESTTFGEWPYMCALFMKTGEKETFLSGASLIAPGVALTVAHWIFGLQNKIEKLYVRCGDWNLYSNEITDLEPERFVEIQVQNISIHPGFDLTTARNDYGLLHLAEDFTLTENIDTVCLPTSPATATEYLDECYAAGWGKDSNGDASKIAEILRQVKLPLVNSSDCQNALRTQFGPGFVLHKSFVCAGGKRGEDTCKGDGGGPLLCRLPGVEEERFVLAGSVAWGYQCGLPNIPGVYASTAHGLCFIDDAIKCVHRDAYKDFVNIQGCDGWLETEKAAYQVHKRNMESVVKSSTNDETRKTNAKKELEKVTLALDRIEEYRVQCPRTGQDFNPSVSSDELRSVPV